MESRAWKLEPKDAVVKGGWKQAGKWALECAWDLGKCGADGSRADMHE